MEIKTNNEIITLKAKNLGKSYGNKRAVQDISLAASTSEIVGLLGPNGAGKTTCFYMLTGMVKPNFGSIHLNDEDITDVPMYKRARMGIGYLPQESSIFRGLNVEDNIMAILEVTEPVHEKRVHRLDELLSDFSISHLRKTDSIRLSGGERRRVEIARSLAINPKFICLDEPLAGIDPIAISDIKNLILQLKGKGIGVIITDHNVRETLDIVDRAYIINEGLVLVEGTPKAIVSNKMVRSVYLGESF
jgi:lipopolysaccharide export system ATP-binding protein